MTQINDFTPSEVAIVGGCVPEKQANNMFPETLEFVLAHREGENLDTLFTTVFEPYRNERYFEKLESAEVTVKEGAESEDDVVRAIKLTQTNGRVDYIVYATNNSVTYDVAGVFDFRGFVGVYSVNAENRNIYRYVNDGDIIGEATEKTGAYEGKVEGFTKDLVMENYIDISFGGATEEELADIEGRMIIIENDKVQNGAYLIKGAEKLSEETVRLDIGMVSPVRGHKDPTDFEGGYIYNIEEGQGYVIPTSFADENLPEFDAIPDNISTSAGSSIEVTVSAQSPLELPVTYKATTLPRGASFDTESGRITWKPDKSQLGENHFAITAVDIDGREATIHFNITVYGSTTGGTSGGSGGSGSSSNSGTTATIPSTSADKDDEKDNASSSTDNGDKTPSVGDADSSLGEGAENSRFIDLGNHAWAADAINALADEGIIKGTSENTFSPAANITRADFAILLVRAFKLASDNEENFADVADSDYFAKELAIARNTGLVNGIGENKFAPRNNITRQDMMVIVYRALDKLGKKPSPVGEGGPLAVDEAFTDYDKVADYARDAVASLINAKLINGKNGLIDPTDYTTRAEVAVLIQRILDFVK